MFRHGLRACEVVSLTWDQVHFEPRTILTKGYQLAQRGVDTRAIQAYLGHRDIKSTVVYTQLDPARFKNFGSWLRRAGGTVRRAEDSGGSILRPVKFDELTKSAFDAQLMRIEKLRAKIAARDMVVKPGRVVPDDAELTIGTGRRLDAAVLFIDISGFTGRLSNTLEEQEVLLRLLSFFFTEMIAIVEDYGGFVEKNTGDGLMAYFEDRAGKPEENAAIRAVACALTMFYTTEKALNPVVAASKLEPIQFRAGIEFGGITVAQVGKAKGYNSVVAVGTPANLASKMLNFAKAGEIVIGSKLRLKLSSAWLKWCERLEEPSGFVYVSSGEPYVFYRYTGRWKDPISYSSLYAMLSGPPKSPPAIPPPPGWTKNE